MTAVRMERSFAWVLVLLNSLTKPSVRTFNDRLRLQKLVFLARQVGFDVGFSFSWYIHGPYSPSLTNFLYTANSTGILGASPEIPPAEKHELEASVNRLKELLHEDVDNPKTLELLASVWYALPQGLVEESRKKAVARMLNQIKPDFAYEEYLAAADRIISFQNSR